MKKIKFTFNEKMPMPMIAIYQEPNTEVFESIASEKEFLENFNHIWSMGSYIIYDDSEIKTFLFEEFINLIYLLRFMRKNWILELSDKEFEQNQEIIFMLNQEIEVL